MLDERRAFDVMAVRAIETADDAQALLSASDRSWASRVAAEFVGAGGAPHAFLAKRAQLLLERASDRAGPVRRSIRGMHWRRWPEAIVLIAALCAGVAMDRIGGGGAINVLAPPVLALLLWNVVVYALLALRPLLRPNGTRPPGLIRHTFARIALGGRQRREGLIGAAMTQFAVDWTRLAAPVHAARVARIFHLAAAVLAAGVIAGLYLRGIALEYRATWESTFLDASSVRRVLAVVLAPGAALTGLEIPSTAHIETIRAPATENAARWLHLMAATVAAVVIVPRLLLALLAWLLERRRAAHIPLDLDGAYYQRILRGFHGAPARVHVVPYSYTPAAPAVAGLERLIARAFGAGTALTLRTPVAYGAETGTGIVPIDASSILVLFNAAATPERETHGGFLGAIATERGSEHAPIVLVDESALRTRWGSDGERMEQRRRIWRELCAEHEVPCAFVDLANGESTDGEAALERALDEAAR